MIDFGVRSKPLGVLNWIVCSDLPLHPPPPPPPPPPPLLSNAIYANRLYLSLFRRTHPQLLAASSEDGPVIIGDVRIHPTATVDRTAVVSAIGLVWLHLLINQVSVWSSTAWPQCVCWVRSVNRCWSSCEGSNYS